MFKKGDSLDDVLSIWLSYFDHHPCQCDGFLLSMVYIFPVLSRLMCFIIIMDFL